MGSSLFFSNDNSIDLIKKRQLSPVGMGLHPSGLPATLIVLILTLIYGIWRLKNLGGPGIEEFRERKDPPWQGQKKGF